MPTIGAHVSAAVSLEMSIERARSIGADCFQIFISPPRQWNKTVHNQEEILRYKVKVDKSGIGPNFIHGTYLVNLASGNSEHIDKSIDWLAYALDIAGEAGVKGVIFHTGSHTGRGFENTLPQIVKAIEKIFTKVLASGIAPSPFLILENSAGAGGSIGGQFAQLGQIIKQVNHDRVKICLDTCHAFAAGYDVGTKQGLQKTLEEFDKAIGLKNLVAIHANDSKFDLGSGKDRHANIGEGFIGSEGFANMLNHPSLKHLPFILEVPGFAETGPDKGNIDTLKSLINLER